MAARKTGKGPGRGRGPTVEMDVDAIAILYHAMNRKFPSVPSPSSPFLMLAAATLLDEDTLKKLVLPTKSPQPRRVMKANLDLVLRKLGVDFGVIEHLIRPVAARKRGKLSEMQQRLLSAYDIIAALDAEYAKHLLGEMEKRAAEAKAGAHDRILGRMTPLK